MRALHLHMMLNQFILLNRLTCHSREMQGWLDVAIHEIIACEFLQGSTAIT